LHAVQNESELALKSPQEQSKLEQSELEQSELEQRRLEALYSYQILDTPFEAAFDHITRLAGRLFEVPLAMVTLIDRDRQWFKSCYGTDGDVRETERSISLCNVTIASSGVMVVPDTTLDSRFADFP